jgi:hypothetical protein
VAFPATAVDVADANTLDDYEEGTWTPTRNGFTEVMGGGSITNTGTYTKIGRLVYAHAKIVCAGGATLAAVAGVGSFLSGLPFSSADPGGGVWNNTTTALTFGGVYVSGTNMFITTAWVAASNTWTLDATYSI